MNISILIPNHNDLRMKNLIQSIDYTCDSKKKVELVIVLNNPTKELKEQCENIHSEYKDKFLFNFIYTDRQNLGYLYNIGLQASSFDHVMFLDSDIICEPYAIEKIIESMDQDTQLVKANLIYKNMNGFVEKARFCNTTKDIPPYIPVILIKKDIFKLLKDNFVFAVDVVWCSDAEFAYRVINEDIPFKYCEANFYHDKITLKKDVKDAILYGFGKGIRIKRTKEEWNPFKEIREMKNKSSKHNLSILEMFYSVFWISLQQVSCGIQIVFPNFFKNSMNFDKSLKVSELFNDVNLNKGDDSSWKSNMY
ncbi:hypothetical protein DOK67_0000370 [Enterococcus sp. DIV0212c]|uniref:glycosyltransferase family 2 protein n=1 Tax=Enterococcus sp. DIV0212c TaxID=2230867 RepID=UPI001A9B3F2E|nr:glycosyltransferase family 2 protein [Enterococcus sp. DIV0212c]MBO1352921.1 glycosyltransferase family 2 protein [Enterococcus sp. DIV0212c]